MGEIPKGGYDRGTAPAPAAATAATAAGAIFLPSLLKLILGGGARFLRPATDRTRTTWEWIAHELVVESRMSDE